MKNINVEDYFKVDENHSKIRGFVFCRDKDGNLVFNKENMIVKSGRSLILNAITNTKDTNEAKLDITSLKRIYQQ